MPPEQLIDPVMRSDPFPHVLARSALPASLALDTLRWFETDAPWRLRVASFYEQWEIHLDAATLPSELTPLLHDRTVSDLARHMLPGGGGDSELVDVTAHRLLPGQTIRIHNDHRPAGETGRVLVQLNRGWNDEWGGLLMLFGSAAASDVRRVIRPVHGSVFGFEISPTSFHAVSTIVSGERFTLVYSYRHGR